MLMSPQDLRRNIARDLDNNGAAPLSSGRPACFLTPAFRRERGAVPSARYWSRLAPKQLGAELGGVMEYSHGEILRAL